MSSYEPGGMEKPVFDILENLFEDVEAYSPMWSVEDESPYRITEESLRREARTALQDLDAHLQQSSNQGPSPMP
jgi:hypothetical protein